MAIAKMDHITLLGVRSEMTGVVNALSSLGVMDVRRNEELEKEIKERRLISPSHSYFNEIPGLDFHEAFRTRMAQLGDELTVDDGLLGRAMTDYPRYIAETQRLMDRLDSTVALCAKILPQKKPMFKKRRKVTEAEFRALASRQKELTDKVRELEDLDQLLRQLEVEQGRTGQKIAELEIFSDISLPDKIKNRIENSPVNSTDMLTRVGQFASKEDLTEDLYVSETYVNDRASSNDLHVAVSASPAKNKGIKSVNNKIDNKSYIQQISDMGYIRIYVGSVQDSDTYNDMIEALKNSDCDAYDVEKLRIFDEGIALIIAVYKDQAQDVYRIACQNGFRNLPELDAKYDGIYSLALNERKSDLEDISKEIDNCKNKMKEIAKLRNDFEMLSDFYRVRHELLKGMEKIAQTSEVFVIEGYVPQKKSEEMFNILTQRFHLAMSRREASPEENYPVLLENNKFVKPFEEVVSMFSLPKPGEDIDPTALMAPTYAFFFGLMLSDIGYGLVLAILTAFLLWKVKVESRAMRNMCYVLFMGGLMAIVWGAMFGGFFGDLINAMSQKKLNFAPLWFNPFDDPTKLMLFSVIFGVIHIFLGMAINMYQLIKRGNAYSAFAEVFPWYLIIGSGFLYAGFRSKIFMYTALLGVFIIVFLSPNPSKNPFKRIMGGLLKLYGVTSFFSDILSYTRILALSLATSVIAMVVNMLASLVGPSLLGIIIAIPILLVGHIMNLALSGLSAYVHTTRLQYVEFFGRFYTGGGEEFKPFKGKTEYVVVESADKKLLV